MAKAVDVRYQVQDTVIVLSIDCTTTGHGKRSLPIGYVQQDRRQNGIHDIVEVHESRLIHRRVTLKVRSPMLVPRVCAARSSPPATTSHLARNL